VANRVADSREFIRGAARYNDLAYVLTKVKALVGQSIAHTSVIGVDQGRWGDTATTDWDSTAIAVAKRPSEKLVFVGEDGDVCTYVGGQSATESISPAPKLIRNAKTIDGNVVACGMLRQVYKRVGEGEWKNISAPSPKTGEKVGFEAIDGYSGNELYAAGWNGEIWEYDGKGWTNRVSPTNAILTAVCCAGDGVVYVSGQQGVMIKGRHDRWESIEWEENVDVGIWDLCWFNEKLYVATMTNLYTLQGNQLVSVDFGGLGIPSCCSLTQAEGVMWSIGKEDVLSFDGATWRRYD
jgi:hypothetical protein